MKKSALVRVDETYRFALIAHGQVTTLWVVRQVDIGSWCRHDFRSRRNAKIPEAHTLINAARGKQMRVGGMTRYR